jgi:ribosome maturation factor RimP
MVITENNIREFVAEQLKDSGCFIVEVSLKPSKITVLLDKNPAITIEECSKVSRALTHYLEPSGILDNHDMEVGSPGMDQPLKVIPQYIKRIGREVNIKLTDGTEKKGVLKSINADNNTLQIEETLVSKEKGKKTEEKSLVELSLDKIKETRIIISFK